MEAKLVIVGGKANKTQVAVKLPAVIGRSREADVTVAHPMISRKHCQLYEVDGLVMVRDLGSLNGLFVGREQVSEARLDPSAEFTIGPITFRIEYQYAGEVAADAEASTVGDTAERELAGQGPQSQDGDPVPVVGPPEGVAEAEETLSTEDDDDGFDFDPDPVAGKPVIAPPDGELPDFSAWAAGEAEPEPTPPPPPSEPAAGTPREPDSDPESSAEEEMGEVPRSGPDEPEEPEASEHEDQDDDQDRDDDDEDLNKFFESFS